jgi:hypothetical protein
MADKKPPVKTCSVGPIRGVPVHLYRAFKAKCVLRGIAMNDKVISMMLDYVQNPNLPGHGIPKTQEETDE